MPQIVSAKLRAAIIDAYHGICQYCGAAGADHIEHIDARATGGSDQPENLTLACRRCNSRKSALTLPEPYRGILLARALQKLPGIKRVMAGSLAADEYETLLQMRRRICLSGTVARLRTEVLFCFSSKYALALYEMIQKRRYLKRKTTEDFTVDEFRKLLGVPKTRLPRFADFKVKAIKPAVAEVNALGDYHVQIDSIRHGRFITKLRLIWFPKDEQGLKAAYTEVQRHKAGRKARIGGTAEVIAGPAVEP
jgi:hypothetical protein